MTEFVGRVGTFFLLMGLGFGLLFIASDLSAATGPGTDYNFLCISTILFSLGFYFRARGAPPPEPSGRFRFIRNVNAKRKQKIEEKAKAKQAKK